MELLGSGTGSQEACLRVWKCELEKAPAYCKQTSMGHSGGSLEDKNAGRNLKSGGLVRKVSVANKDFAEAWTGGHSSYLLPVS